MDVLPREHLEQHRARQGAENRPDLLAQVELLHRPVLRASTASVVGVDGSRQAPHSTSFRHV